MSNESIVVSGAASDSAVIYTSIESAQAVKVAGYVLVSKKWKETAKQSRMERAVWIREESLQAPEVPSSFRALVESALLQSAVGVLAKFVVAEPNCFEVDLGLFQTANLVESFLSRGEVWFSREDLEREFVASATWKRISGRNEFKVSRSYQKAAESFKETVLKLAGKTSKVSGNVCDLILAKMETEDFATEFGSFIVRRIEAMKSRQEDEIDLSAL